MTDTPICASVERDLAIDVDKLTGSHPAPSEPESTAPSDPVAL